MIKKIISVILSIMLMASMFTGVVFAQETTVTVSSLAGVTVKYDGTHSTYNGISAQKWTRMAFGTFDFSDCIPYLYAADNIQFWCQTYGGYEVYGGLTLDALDDSKEQYVNSNLVWNTITEQSMHTGGRRLAYNENNSTGVNVSLVVDKENLIAALETGSDGVVAVRFDTSSGSNTQLPYYNFKINYNDETYMQTIADGLEWSDVSEQPENEITQNLTLPSKLHGCDVTWESNSTAIDAKTGIVTVSKGEQEVVLTASLSHGGKTATKEFKVVVVGEKAIEATVKYSNYGSARSGEKLGIAMGRFIYSGGAYSSVAQLNLAGYEEIIKNPGTSLKLTLVSEANVNNGNLSDYTVYLASDKADVYTSGVDTYETIQALGVIDKTRPVFAVDSDGQTTSAASSAVTVDANKENLIKALDELGSQNSVVTLYITTKSSSAILMTSGGLTISYFESEVNDAAYFQELKEDFKLENLTTDSATSLTNDLPAFFRGATVEWSSNKDVITSDGKLKRSEDSAVEATLTANVSYKDYSFTESFDVKIAKIAYAYGDELYEGTKSISKGATDANFTIESADGVYGKVASDKVYKISAQSSETFAIIDTSAATDANDVFEFSAYVPENAGNLNFNIGIEDGSKYGAQALLTIKNDGIYNNYSNNKKIISEFNDGWHTFAFVAPKGDGVDNTFELYIDGKKVSENPVAVTTSGFRHIRVSAGGTDINVASGYMDNIRTYSGEYTPKYDTLDNISYAEGINGKNLLIKDERTVAEIKEGITADEDTSIRIYQNLAAAPLADAEYVKDGYIVVAASKSGTEIERSFNVYTIDRLEYEATIKTLVNGSQAKVYNSGDTLRAEVEFNSYVDNKSFDATLYVAQYKYGELINLWTEPKTNITDGYTFTCDFENITDIENSNIKIMLVDNEFNPYCETGKMRFNNSNTEATLYLLGDSIVQTYEEPSYPIQGWGNFIGNYLNDSITVDNRATSGWSTDHYLYPEEKGVTGTANEYKTWENIKSDLKAGDYVMVSLGINDAGSAQISEEKYRENLETIYSEATAIGATVIFTTPTILGKDWGFTGMGFGYGGYESRGAICQSIADGHNSVCLPLGAELLQLYNGMAEEYLAQNPDKTRADANNYVGNYFHIYAKSSTNPPEGWDNFGTATEDDTMHYNPTGANKVASVIAQLIMESDSSLADYVVIPNN